MPTLKENRDCARCRVRSSAMIESASQEVVSRAARLTVLPMTYMKMDGWMNGSTTVLKCLAMYVGG